MFRTCLRRTCAFNDGLFLLTQRIHQLRSCCPGGTVRIVDSTNFSISTRIAAALVEVKPGGMRELHWHPNYDEWQYYLTGTARMTAFAASGTSWTFNYRAGDVGYVPFAFGHYIQNTGDESLWFLEMFK